MCETALGTMFSQMPVARLYAGNTDINTLSQYFGQCFMLPGNVFLLSLKLLALVTFKFITTYFKQVLIS